MDLYSLLGVQRDASESEIKKAYKNLAKKYHPDINPDPSVAEKFKRITAAYGVLKDSNKRRSYDRRGQGGFGGGGPDIFNMFNPWGGASDFSSIFSNISNTNLNCILSISIGFLEPRAETTKRVKFSRRTKCKICKGSGAKSYHTSRCGMCQGSGTINKVMLGVLFSKETCRNCRGNGKKIKEKCKACIGGETKEKVELVVNIPAGIMTGKTLRVVGEGHHVGGRRGDLLLQIMVLTPPLSGPSFERIGADVRVVEEIPYTTLILGGSISVDTIWGKETIPISPKTKPGTAISLSGKGFPLLGRLLASERGRHQIIVSLAMPKINSSEHTDLLTKLKALYDK